MSLRERKNTCIEELLRCPFFLNSENTRLSLDFERKKSYMQGFFYQFNMVLLYILSGARSNWVYIYIFKNGQHMLGTCQQVSAARTNQTVFDAPCHLKHGDEAHVPRRQVEELPPSILLENRVAHCKKTRKSGYLFVKLNYIIIFFYCNVFGIKSFIKLIFFFNFIHLKFIFISELVLILLIIVYLVLNYLSGYFFFKFIPLHLVYQIWSSLF